MKRDTPRELTSFITYRTINMTVTVKQRKSIRHQWRIQRGDMPPP